MMNEIELPSINFLKSHNIAFKVIYLTEIPKTAQDVERLYSCSLKQVLKTLVFITDKDPVLVVLPGNKKVDLNKLRKITKSSLIRLGTPQEIKDITGYLPGGVSPFGIQRQIAKIIDQTVFDEKLLNVGSGVAEIGIELASSDLKNIWDGTIADISQ